MSLSGQWIAKYSGTNNGTGIIDLDEFDTYFSGTAVAWDDNPQLPNSIVQIRTPSKSSTQHLTKLPVFHIDTVGNPLSMDRIKQLAANNITLPSTVDMDLNFNGSTLTIQWSSSIGTHGAAVANGSRTQGGLPSDLRATSARGWDGFKKK